MNIQKLISYISFITLLTTNDALVNKYNIVLIKTLELLQNQNKKQTLSNLSNLYKELNIYLNDNISLLSRKEKKYLRALKNLVMQLRRYLKIQESKEFPNILFTLTAEEFKLGIEELSKEKKISKDILLLSKPYSFDFKVLQPNRKGINPFKK
jgi:hypothetical protein